MCGWMLTCRVCLCGVQGLMDAHEQFKQTLGEADKEYNAIMSLGTEVTRMAQQYGITGGLENPYTTLSTQVPVHVSFLVLAVAASVKSYTHVIECQWPDLAYVRALSVPDVSRLLNLVVLAIHLGVPFSLSPEASVILIVLL